MTCDGIVSGNRSTRDLARRVAGLATARGLMVATAESCTGGLVAKTITDLPGASAHFRGGVVAYANDAKVRQLDIDAGDIDTHGAVSSTVALQMALGACRRFSADVGMAVTGIAGPAGGTAEKPVGTVWIAVAYADGTGTSRLENLVGGRSSIREESVAAVLRLAAEVIVDRDS